MEKRKRLGEIFVEHGILTEKTVERMLQVLLPLPDERRLAAAYLAAGQICEEDVVTNEAIGHHGACHLRVTTCGQRRISVRATKAARERRLLRDVCQILRQKFSALYGGDTSPARQRDKSRW